MSILNKFKQPMTVYQYNVHYRQPYKHIHRHKHTVIYTYIDIDTGTQLYIHIHRYRHSYTYMHIYRHIHSHTWAHTQKYVQTHILQHQKCLQLSLHTGELISPCNKWSLEEFQDSTINSSPWRVFGPPHSVTAGSAENTMPAPPTWQGPPCLGSSSFP